MKLFDSHFHIIDSRFPLIANQGYMPDFFSVKQYVNMVKDLNVCSGAVVSGSFQGFDQGYLVKALQDLGEGFVGVTQLPASVRDEEILDLHQMGIRAVRFNLKRGGSERVDKMEEFAKRVFDLVQWHVELYIDSRDLAELKEVILRLPMVSIDHLGLSKSGFQTLLHLVEKGVFVKATGFGRLDFDPKTALKELAKVNPDALMFGTDLPSTRAPRPFQVEDVALICELFEADLAEKILYKNGLKFYRLSGG